MTELDDAIRRLRDVQAQIGNHGIETGLQLRGPDLRLTLDSLEQARRVAVAYDESTLRKVYSGLDAAGVVGQQAIDAVNQMLNEGVLFRTRATKEQS